MEFQFNENIDTMFRKLEEFFRSNTVVGESIVVGNVTLIPIIDVSLGLGLGGGDGTDDKGNKGTGSGGGLGAKGSPTAVIVIKDDSIELLSIKKSASLEKLIDMVPELVTRINVENLKREGKKED